VPGNTIAWETILSPFFRSGDISLCEGYAEDKAFKQVFWAKSPGGNDMNRVERMVPFRTVPILLIVAGLLAAGGFVAGANWSAGTRTGHEMPSTVEDEAVIGVEAEASADANTEVDAATGTSQQAPATRHNWLPEEMGAGSPGVVGEGEGVLEAEGDVMSLGRSLESERDYEWIDPELWHEYMRHKLGLGSGMDSTLWHEFMEFKRNREPGLQPGI
jgi:hypothetical protein